MKDTLIVYTGVNLKMLETEGGSGYWRLSDEKSKNIKYLLAIKNHSQIYAKDKNTIPNGTAFLIAKVAGTFNETDPNFKGKKVIKITDYYEISIPNAWLKLTGKSGQLAFRYKNFNEISQILDFQIDETKWKKFTPSSNPKPCKTRFLKKI